MERLGAPIVDYDQFHNSHPELLVYYMTLPLGLRRDSWTLDSDDDTATLHPLLDLRYPGYPGVDAILRKISEEFL